MGAIRLALVPVIEQMEARPRTVVAAHAGGRGEPGAGARLVANSAAAERAMIDAVAARIGVGPDHTYPPLVVAVTGAAFRTAMIRWAAGGARRPLAGLVDEAFAVLAAGLADPARRHPRTSRADTRRGPTHHEGRT